MILTWSRIFIRSVRNKKENTYKMKNSVLSLYIFTSPALLPPYALLFDFRVTEQKQIKEVVEHFLS